MAKTKDSPNLLDLFKSASAADLEEIDKLIAEKQTELDQATAKLASELAALQQLRKVIDIKINGKPERAKPGRPRQSRSTSMSSQTASEDAPGATANVGDRIEQILKAAGPCSVRTLALKLGIGEHAVKMSLGHNKRRFIKDIETDCWELCT